MSSHKAASSDSSEDTVPDYGSNDVTVDESLSLMIESLSMDDRPVSLSYQVEPLIAETLQNELQTSLLYDHVVNGNRYRAWEFTDTGSEALVEITVTDGDSERVHYARPPMGEAVMDLRWWLIHGHVNSDEISIETIRNQTVEMLLSSSPNEWHPGLQSILNNAM